MPLTLSWDNIAILANPNVIAQRALQRLKIIGGTFYTTGFFPANDLSVSFTSVIFTGYIVNKIYEFKVQAICSSGGPTNNDNGIREGIIFACIIPEYSPTAETISIGIDTTGTDITGAVITLRKQSDNAIAGGPNDEGVISNEITTTFTGLTNNTDYYIQIQFYTILEGTKYLAPNICGGNITNYQVSTLLNDE